MAENGEHEVEIEQGATVQDPTSDVPAANGAADADPEARFRYDDALLIKVKGKVKRPSKPDEAERDVPLNKLKAEIDKYSARIKEIKDTVEASRSSRDSQSAGNKEIIKRLQVLRNEFQSVLRQKQHIREELQATLKNRDDLRTASRQMRDRLPRGVNMDNLEAQLAELEYKMQHESGADDKYLFKRIQELNQARPMLREYTETEAKLKSLDGVRADIQARLSQCDAVLNDVKAREEAERATLDEARGKQAANEPDIPALNSEKKECWDIIQALRAKMDDVRKEFSAKYVEWIKLDKNYNNYMRSVKRKEWEERQKAREARETAQLDADAQDPSNPNPGAATAAGTAAADAPVVEAYAAEVFTLDQLLTYLRKLVPADVQAAAAESQKKELEVPKGMKLLKKNTEDDFFSVARKKPVGKKGSAAAPAAAEPSSSSSSKPAVDSGKRKLNHTLELLQTFMRFSIEVPQTVAELPATIDKAEAKKAYYLELRRTGRKHEEPKPAKKEAAAPASSEASGSSGAAQGAAPTPAEAAQQQAEQRGGATTDAPADAPAEAAAAPAEEEEEEDVAAPAAAAPAPAEEEDVAAAADSSTGPAQEEEQPAPAPMADEFEAAAAPAPAAPAPAELPAVAAADEEVEEPAAAQEEAAAAAAPATTTAQPNETPSSGLGVDLAVDEASGTVALKLNLAA